VLLYETDNQDYVKSLCCACGPTSSNTTDLQLDPPENCDLAQRNFDDLPRLHNFLQ